jgi:ParB-like chromosome segregation protein Spo0J
MRIEKEIYIQHIVIDHLPMNPSTLNLIDHLRNGGKIPAIKVARLPDGKYLIRDGRHRLLAYLLLGRKKIKARYSNKLYQNIK